jgi:long-chain acyl-CoA synthetase
MPNFLENTFAQLQKASGRTVLREIHGTEFVSVSGAELLDQIGRARVFLRQAGLEAGDRCALLGPNSVRWAAIDLALMAEGVVVVPLYARQAPGELAAMLQGCTPPLLIASDATLGEAIAQTWSAAPRRVTFDEVFQAVPAGKGVAGPLKERRSDDLVTIIYTSGTSGEPKGVCLSRQNLDHMLGCTTGWMDGLEKSDREPLRVFQYLPFNFAASWIVMMSCLSRETVLTLSTDLNNLGDEIRLSAPQYFFNVPTLLERVKRGVEDLLAKRAWFIQTIYKKGCAGWQRRQDAGAGGGLWLFLAQKLIFSKIRDRFGPDLRGLVCGSAPLAPETQEFFAMLGIPIWQVYGLTETCGICTMDNPRLATEPGRVGQAVPGIEMKTGDNDEILVRGPHIFPGYWNRPKETARVLEGGWFHTGDQGEMNSRGNWRISGRIKNLIILNSGHNIAPEPIEEKIAQLLPGAQQVVVVGNGRGYLCALAAGAAVEPAAVQAALDEVNSELPHYRQVRSFAILLEAFTPENGLLTANGKLKRETINKKYRDEIEQMYRKQAAAVGSNA